MDFVADTSILISFLSGAEPAASSFLSTVEKHRLRLPSIVAFELLCGVKPGTKRAHDLDELLMITPVIPLDLPGALQASRIYRDLRKRGLDIGVSDSLIAGIALSQGLPLYTENVAHFSRVRDLVVWTLTSN